jgi:hypothetical protein
MEEKEKTEKVNEYRKRFVRWHELTLNQLSNTNNLILTLTTAILAFSVSKTELRLPTDCCVLGGFIISYALLLGSVLAGLLLTFNRLNDFRKTKDKIKYKRQRFETENGIKNHGDINTITKSIDKLETETEELGQQTWSLLRWQLWTFLIGCAFILVTILIQHN